MASKTYKIKFTQTRMTKEANPQTFQEGQVYEVNEASRDRWLRRNCAIDVTDEPAPAPAVKKADPEKKS